MKTSPIETLITPGLLRDARQASLQQHHAWQCYQAGAWTEHESVTLFVPANPAVLDSTTLTSLAIRVRPPAAACTAARYCPAPGTVAIELDAEGQVLHCLINERSDSGCRHRPLRLLLAGTRDELLPGSYPNMESALPMINEWLNAHLRLSGLQPEDDNRSGHLNPERLAATAIALIDAGNSGGMFAAISNGLRQMGVRLTHVAGPEDAAGIKLDSRRGWSQLLRMHWLIVVGGDAEMRLLTAALACACLIPAIYIADDSVTVHWPGGACPFCQQEPASAASEPPAASPASRQHLLTGMTLALLESALQQAPDMPSMSTSASWRVKGTGFEHQERHRQADCPFCAEASAAGEAVIPLLPILAGRVR